MGEAKRRKAKEANYGRPSRGLILTSKIEPLENGVGVHGGPDPQELRYALLFWDKLVWPTNNMIHAGGDQDTDFLQSAKILERPRYQFPGGLVTAEPFVRSQLEEFKKRNDSGKGIWDICQNTATLLSEVGELTDKSGIGIELVDAIPVPDKDVPLNEILEFKSKREDEFKALRAELDNLGGAILKAEHPDTELQRVSVEIDKACADALKVCAEWQCPVRLSNVKMALDLKPFELVAGAMATPLIASAPVLTLTQSVLVGITGAAYAAKSALKITADIGLQSIRRRQSPFAYVAHLHKELF